jgi:hypothetical protein
MLAASVPVPPPTSTIASGPLLPTPLCWRTSRM